MKESEESMLSLPSVQLIRSLERVIVVCTL